MNLFTMYHLNSCKFLERSNMYRSLTEVWVRTQTSSLPYKIPTGFRGKRRGDKDMVFYLTSYFHPHN